MKNRAINLYKLFALMIFMGCSSLIAATQEVVVVRGLASQSSNYSAAYPASNALDNNAGTFTHTLSLANSYWQEDLLSSYPITKIELVNRADVGTDTRMGGLTLRIFDSNMVSLVSTIVTNPGVGGTWTYVLPEVVTGKYVRVGLENNAMNQGGNYYVTLAEARVYGLWTPVDLVGTNIAVGKDSFMTRLVDTLPPASYANDGNLATSTETTPATVDGYWEVDLGALYAVTGVRIFEKDGMSARLKHATVRLFDENHESVYSQHLSLMDLPLFSVNLGGTYRARYVRIGLENKERTSPTGGTEWHIGFKEVEVLGKPLSETGIIQFGASVTNLTQGQATTLSWQVADVDYAFIYDGNGWGTNVTGLSSITLNPYFPTCYTLVATNKCSVFDQAIAVTVDGQSPTLRLEEVVASNEVSLEDGYGDVPDWIEIRNPSGSAIPLLGYGLSDNMTKPFKWTFPDVTIPAFGRLIVFASDKAQKIDPEGFLHASFKLSDEGESIKLTAPNATVLDTVTFPAQREDLAYARNLEGTWGFADPTPQKINQSTRYQGWLQDVSFSQKRGFCTNAFALAIDNPNPDSTLLVSTNGTEPSVVYTGPIQIDNTRVVRARVIRPGYHSHRTETQTYIFIEALLASSLMNANTIKALDPLYTATIRQGLNDLPTISVALPEVKDDYFEREGSVEILWSSNDTRKAVQANCGIEQFGGSYQDFAKKSWRLNFRKIFGAGKLQAPLLNGFDRGFSVRESFNKLELRSGSQDMKDRGFYMASRFVDDSMMHMGNLNPHGRYVNLYLNGTYWGQYDLREALDDAFLASYLGGKQEDYLVVRGNDNTGDNFVTGTPDPLSRYSWYNARAIGTNYHAVKTALDVQSLVDFMLLWNYGYCESEYRCAGPVNAGSGFKFWMADSDGFLRLYTGNRTGANGPGSFFQKLRTDTNPDFKMFVADRIYKHFYHNGALTPAQNQARLDTRMAEVQNSMFAECARWGYRTPSTWLSDAATIGTSLFPVRGTQVVGFLRSAGLFPAFDPPVLTQQGGVVTNGFPVLLSSPVGAVYYTLDGTDPRLPGGGISPSAILYLPPGIDYSMIASNAVWRYWDKGGIAATTWRERLFDDSTWSSGAAELGYGDAPTTTISYGPSSGSKYITSYFRKDFVVQDARAFNRLKIDLLRDDGAVLYLNGTEILRHNMPAGSVTSNTLATAAVGGADENTFFFFDLSSQPLISGTNVLAVEIHQSSGGSSDLSFNLAMSAYQSSNQIVIASNTLVYSRVLYTNVWSALNQATFYLPGRETASVTNLVVSEIHYNPPGYENEEAFVELMNVSSNEVDLSGMTLSDAVSFTFPSETILQPGAFIIVVEDAACFAACYQSPSSPYYYPGIRVAGEWAGALSTSGETLVVRATNNTTIASITYSTSKPWPSRADGEGSSLELIAPLALPIQQPERDAVLNSASSWQASAFYQGSPGRLGVADKSLVINEVLSHTDADEDWIEILNTGATQISLGNLFISDNYNTPLRFSIPEEMELAPGEFTRFTATQLGFAFSELGEKAILVEASNTNVIRFIDVVSIPAVEREEPVGRYALSDGSVDFTELRTTTPNAANALPRVGPVIFGELMANPESGRAAYAVLVNLTGAATPLFDPERPANVWKLSGAIDFLFPGGQLLPPYGILIVCSTNESAFRLQYGVEPSVPVYGPWTGGFMTSDGELVLRRPGVPELDGEVPYYRVDRVVCRPGSLWPTPLTGNSIIRRPLKSYGNDPVSWRLSTSGLLPGGYFADYRAPAVQIEGGGLSEAGFQMSAPTFPGESYHVDYTDQLNMPDWHELFTLPSAPSTLWQFVDATATNAPQRFYRVIWE
jgi:hypothetical protein